MLSMVKVNVDFGYGWLLITHSNNPMKEDLHRKGGASAQHWYKGNIKRIICNI